MLRTSHFMVIDTQYSFKQKSYMIGSGLIMHNHARSENWDNSRRKAGVGTREEAVSKVKVNLAQPIRINLTRSINLNIESKARRFPEENMGDYLHDLWVGKDFLSVS